MPRQYTLYTLVHYLAHTQGAIDYSIFAPYFSTTSLSLSLPSIDALFDVTIGKLPSSPKEGGELTDIARPPPIQNARKRNQEETARLHDEQGLIKSSRPRTFLALFDFPFPFHFAISGRLAF
jgi:hypothetical protein